MKIMIAAWHLKDFNVGLGRYSRSLIEGISRLDTQNHYEILIPENSYQLQEQPNIRYRLIRFPVFKRRLWEQIAPLVVGQYDLLHFPYDSCVALKRGKFVVTIHDMKPYIFPRSRRRLNLNSLMKRILIPNPYKQIDHVLTVSECSRRDIVERLGVPENRVTVVYQGVELERFRPDEANCNRPNVNQRYVLCVAGTDPTKNVETLIVAFSKLPSAFRKTYSLVLAGDLNRQHHLQQMTVRLGVDRETIFMGLVTEEQLVALYQHASVFVFPSWYEGFGLPVLEAMACGCPVICSNTSSLPEVIGEAGILVDPSDAIGLATAIERVLSDSALCMLLRTAGLQRARQFTWDRTARETVELYKKVVEQPSS